MAATGDRHRLRPRVSRHVGSGEVKDFTAFGDVVNTAARLQASAEAGHVVMSERVYGLASERWRDATAVQLELKGKTEAVRAYSLRVSLAAMVARQAR